MGIFGSSTPDHNIENERAEQISKDWVPMRLEEEKAFPIEYVMYYEDRYIAGGYHLLQYADRGRQPSEYLDSCHDSGEKGRREFSFLPFGIFF